jgi:hypothetical protein
MKERQMKRVAISAALVAFAIPAAGAMAQVLSPTPVFEGNTMMQAKNGATQPVDVSVQSWVIAGQEHEIQLCASSSAKASWRSGEAIP